MGLSGETLVAGSSVAAGLPAEAQQPGGRVPAPGELALLQAFLNTHFDLVEDRGADLLATPAGLRRWLTEQRLVPQRTVVSAADLERILVVREGLRELIAARRPGRWPRSRTAAFNRAIAGARIEPRLTPRGLTLAPTGGAGIDRALGRLLSIAARAQLDGSWARLKVCPGRHCGWVFYDHSRNGSSRWCSMSVCGGREKARAHYRRQRGE